MSLFLNFYGGNSDGHEFRLPIPISLVSCLCSHISLSIPLPRACLTLTQLLSLNALSVSVHIPSLCPADASSCREQPDLWFSSLSHHQHKEMAGCTIESNLPHHTRKAESENYYGYHATQQRILSLLKDLVLAGRALEHSVSQGIDPFS